MATDADARRISVSLSLHGSALDPADVTAALLMEPDKAAKQGQSFPDGVTAPIGYWNLKSKPEAGSECEDHIAWLLDRLDGQGAIPADIEGVDRTAISCLWQANRLLTGPTFSADLLRRLGAYRLPLEITFDHAPN